MNVLVKIKKKMESTERQNERMDAWAHGWSRLPNAIAEILGDCGKKAQVMGVCLWLVSKAQKIAQGGLMRGQVRMSWEADGKELGLSAMQLRRAVETIKKTGLVTTMTVREGRKMSCVVSVCDFDNYNGLNYAVRQASEEAPRQATDSHADSQSDSSYYLNKEFKKKEIKNDEEKEEKSIAVADLPDYLIAQREWADWFCGSYGMSRETLMGQLSAFAFHLQSRGEMRKSADDALKHFSNWFQVRCSREAKLAREAEEKRAAEAKALEDERRRRAAEAERKSAEEEMKRRKFLAEIFAKADAGDEHAREVIRKHGLKRE